MKKHLHKLVNKINERRDTNHNPTKEWKIQIVIHSLPKSWEHMKVHLMLTSNIATFSDIVIHFYLEEDHLASLMVNNKAHVVKYDPQGFSSSGKKEQ